MAISNSIPAMNSNSLAADARSLDSLKLAAGANDPKAIKEAAKQFESLFMRELLKSMREATMKSGLMDSDGEKLGTDLLDQQFAVQLSGMPGGLTDAIARQLTQQMTGNARGSVPTVSLPSAATRINPTASQNGFVTQHTAAAERVAQATGIPSSFMIGQAGHETGWGRSEIRNADGSNSFNLFGIKAGPGWAGKVATITTTEYIDGEPRKVSAKFRAYDSYEASFRDYARLIGESPRYAQARASTGSAAAYATELQRAGYATDPAYAAKLSRAINSTLLIQRSQQA
ncbi:MULTISPECIES: flagellar assembly peptidoglycan hydrolase FlgJ [unclassified Variovorax]|uniref:flagellar assembly peptidoglycan hydrolase FlgJ n=1 Tax=unclassified Variovorax TaxID=663243 RepID=UPI002575593C|nr:MULTISPECIES: flagellar assembly peptidoglycan hydrolase FlgJ [unclassified Variovorax]MDM0089763.1 flagellar assembly peptidoglycan hydrolase FlgJ [Variovorax sp. J22G40]MDM0148571.1 flagellar assembly peptidoglycan hydrolase FlgJ [Variovorax sp. J2P1-31]